MIIDPVELEKVEHKAWLLDVMATCARCMKRWPHNPEFKEFYKHFAHEYKCITSPSGASTTTASQPSPPDAPAPPPTVS
jgi:hypothetical protein